MEINLEVEERVKVIVEGVCCFKVWGERNEEGTMVMKYQKHDVLEVEDE